MCATKKMMISWTGDASTSRSLEDHNLISISGTLMIEVTCFSSFQDKQFMDPKIVKTKKIFFITNKWYLILILIKMQRQRDNIFF